MTYGHTLDSGVRLPISGADPALPVRWARLAEELGLDLVVVPDRPALAGPEAWTPLSWIAGVTDAVRLATDGHDGTARNPEQRAEQVAEIALRHGTSDFIIASDGPGRPRDLRQGSRARAREIVAAGRG
ncbi:LLM class flavin-dependent oxidoreductase [Pseudonocardia zijingensis]|uniref:Luciferase-like domain-containing protein n=1 Tax=Pseudonocardia zijingensis TaxID=153376 RepID=A0ABP4AU55_9PSEU